MNINDKNFKDEVLNSNIPVLVDFWAEWCTVCRTMTPVIDELKKELEGKVKVCKFEVEPRPTVTSKYDVTSIPTLLLFNKGIEIDRFSGTMSKEEILNIIEIAIKKNE